MSGAWSTVLFSPVLLLLVSLCLFIGSVVLFYVVARGTHPALYRTADESQIDSDVARLQGMVPSPPARRGCTGNCQQGRRCTCRAVMPPTPLNKAAIKCQACAAALADMGTDRVTPNPYKGDQIVEQWIWDTNYARVKADADRAIQEGEA